MSHGPRKETRGLVWPFIPTWSFTHKVDHLDSHGALDETYHTASQASFWGATFLFLGSKRQGTADIQHEWHIARQTNYIYDVTFFGRFREDFKINAAVVIEDGDISSLF